MRRPATWYLLAFAVLAVAGWALLPRLCAHRDAFPRRAAEIGTWTLAQAVAVYVHDQGHDPARLEALRVPWRPGGEPYLEDIPLDPWGHPFVLELGNGPRRVVSFGPDGVPGGGDDIEAPIRARPRPRAAGGAPPVPKAAPEGGPAPAAGVR